MDKCPDEAIKREREDEDCTHYACMSRKVLQHCPTGGNEILSHDIFIGPVLSNSIVDKCPDNLTLFSNLSIQTSFSALHVV